MEHGVSFRLYVDFMSNGSPIIPVKFVPFLLAAYLIAEGLGEVLPQHTIGGKVAKLIASALVALGLASPGLRKADAAGSAAVAANPGGGLASVVDIRKE